MDKTQLPGMDIARKEAIDSMIRVDHAGEYGATRIYEGQIKALSGKTDQSTINTLRHMLSQEEEHLHQFQQQLKKNNTKPTILKPLWHIAGFVMGYLSAKLGTSGAMACTVAVEETIDEHYQEQEKYLTKIIHENKNNKEEKNKNKELYDLVHKCRMEELEHRDIGLENGAKNAPFYKILYTAVRFASKGAIALSKRI